MLVLFRSILANILQIVGNFVKIFWSEQKDIHYLNYGRAMSHYGRLLRQPYTYC